MCATAKAAVEVSIKVVIAAVSDEEWYLVLLNSIYDHYYGRTALLS